MYANALKRQKSFESSPRVEDLGTLYLANSPDCVCFVKIDDCVDYQKYKIIYSNELFNENCGNNELLMDSFLTSEERIQVAATLEYMIQNSQKRCRFTTSHRSTNYVIDWKVSRVSDALFIFTGREKFNQFICDFCENAPVCLHKVSSDGTILWANRAELAFMGYSDSKESYIGHPISEFHVDQQALTCILNKLAAKDVVKGMEAIIKLRNGEHKFVRIDSNARVHEGKFESTRCFTRDFTEVELMERRLKYNEQKYRHLIENAPSVVFEVDMNGTILSVNKAGLLAFSDPQPIGKSIFDFFIEKQKLFDYFHNCTKLQQIEITTQNRVYLLEFIPLRFVNKISAEEELPISSIMGIAHDITDQHLATEAALSASKQKTDFLGKLSHEIRTPMNGIVGLSQLLKDTSLDENQIELVSTLLNCAMTIQKMLNNVFDISKIESGIRTISMSPINLHNVIHFITSLFQLSIMEKGLNFQLEIDDDFSKYGIMSDELSITQIVTNMINNAIKYTETGFIRIFVTKTVKSDSQWKIKISVKDSGIGIAKENLEKIWNRFFQVEHGSKHYDGTGLGLDICKQLAGLLGGEIGCESVLGEGSTFWVTFPCELEKMPNDIVIPTDIPKTTRRPVLHRKVLVAEDNLVNQKVVLAFLRKLNFDGDIASNGQIAVQLASEREYDMILMDCQMPICDGYQATLEIRKFDTTIPIVALTADVVEVSKTKCSMVGMNDFIGKPMTKEKLEEVLKTWLEL